MSAQPEETTQLHVTVPRALAEQLRERIAQGRFHDESEAVTTSLDERLKEEAAVDHWVKSRVLPAVDKAQEDPSRLLIQEEFDARLKRRWGI